MEKADLIQDVEKAIADGTARCIVLRVHMPTGETETIRNPNVEEKIKYIADTYDDDLCHRKNPEIFIKDYSLVRGEDEMDFGSALVNAKAGLRIARKGWNGRGMYVFLATDPEFCTEADISEFEENATQVSDFLVLRTAQGTLQPGWLASQSDILAEDWYVV